MSSHCSCNILTEMRLLKNTGQRLIVLSSIILEAKKTHTPPWQIQNMLGTEETKGHP